VLRLASLIDTQVSAALTPGYLAAYAAGEQIRFGPLTLDHTGLAEPPVFSWQAINPVPWDEIDAVSINGAGVVSMKPRAAEPRTLASRPEIPNLCVLFDLLKHILGERFHQRDPG